MTDHHYHRGRVLHGRAGRGTEVVEVGEHPNPDKRAVCGAWVLWCPGQSPTWHYYSLSIYHLRELPGATVPAIIYVPHATHEVLLYALEGLPNEIDPETWRMLMPLNFTTQITLPSDDEARELLALLANAVIEGALWAEPPLSGQLEPWLSSCLKTAEHFRGEGQRA